ncbi:zinc finger AN1 domain-containing stress-associated protein 15-like [Varroa jacobsoni]|nr:zinc finger AN1 domain-containing stress-associated protein 15-like isoform X2 [Varroa destructor]XP_022659531.1 zinc finger AN1 domain-containing stress-associated protein 15-like isoform X2 [Varroa destructor]XP_022659541.1 zinc finger AN1 domain-containing stress-associated protein 15-like isoform X2 [Varroa destructor]XP_022659552.1 zinc finger AN1 domain-containing stress-associated protein 15-like isoform X2 [Varroa destructor]XP_022710509.1 zinc finger AN1 domain-containing stress-ass
MRMSDSSEQLGTSVSTSPAASTTERSRKRQKPEAEGNPAHGVASNLAVPLKEQHSDDTPAKKPRTSLSSVKRCPVCKGKLKLVSFTCRCGSEFCQRHRNPEDHDCDFDYRDLGKQELMKNNPIIRPKKITKL